MRSGRVVEVKDENFDASDALSEAKREKQVESNIELDHVWDCVAPGVSMNLSSSGTVVVPVSSSYEDDMEEEIVSVSRDIVLSGSLFQHLSSKIKSGAVSIDSFSIVKKYPKKRVEFAAVESFDVLVNGYKVKNFSKFDEADDFARLLSDSTDDTISVRKILGDAFSSDLIRYEPDYPEMVEVSVQWAVRRPVGDKISHWLIFA